jgi:hypothetical protein
VLYSVRYRTALPAAVAAEAPGGKTWVIEGRGRAKYAFSLVGTHRVVPRDDLVAVRVPNATPEAIRLYALDDEQALLAIVRYNRLVDLFLGLTTYSLQNHLRTTARGVGQVEIDELYVGIDKHGCHFIIPVQAKAGDDQHSVVQARQDLAWCSQRFPGMRRRALAAQFMADGRIAMFEVALVENALRVVEERHYLLVSREQMVPADVVNYRS